MSRTVAGRYRLVRAIGSGANAEVWLARDELIGEDVAVKLLRRGTIHARARREIALLRALRVPGVLQMVDEGIDDGQVFVVTELVQGSPFPGRAGPTPWSAIAPTTQALLETLARVHAAGIVHRDLKPANVLVTADGRPIVLDFGVAFVDVEDRLTVDGDMVGTPAYLAPEQIRGEPVTPAADLYAVGVMLFEALAGRLPQPGLHPSEVLRARLLRPPPTLAASATVPETVAKVVRDLLSPEEHDRPRDAHEVLARLEGRATDRRGWLGARSPLEQVEALVGAGRSVVLGARGSERVVDELTRMLGPRRLVRRLAPSERPFGSLAELVGPLLVDLPAATPLATVEAHVDDALRATAPDVFAFDDVDDASRRALERTARVVVTTSPWPDATRVEIPALDRSELEELFVGPNRIHHLAEDAAARLHARTGGHRDLVERELARWVRAGRCRWDRGKLRVTREELDRIEAEPVAADIPRANVDQRLDEILLLGELAGMALDVRLVARTLARPDWEAESDLHTLRSAGALSETGRVLLRSTASAPRRRRLLERLATLLPPSPQRLRALIESTEDWSAAAVEHVVTETIDVARELARAGGTQRSIALLREMLSLVRAVGGSAEQRARLLEAWVGIDAEDAAATTIDRLLYELHREPEPRAPRLEGALRLLRATAELQKWGRGTSDAAEALEPFADRAMEHRRLALRVLAARRASPEREERVIEELVGRAEEEDDDELRARARSWLGKLRYRQGRFAEAAALHASAAPHLRARTERIATKIHAASALQEAFDHDAALAIALEARAEAAQCRHAYLEARAEWMVRSVEYRLGRAHHVDDELLDAVRTLGTPHLIALVTFVEATHGYRAGAAGAPELAREAWIGWRRSGDPLGTLLAGSLASALGALASDERDPLCASAWTNDVPGVGIQTAALLVDGGGARPPRDVVDRLSSGVPREHWSRRMELLSVDEARARLATD